jgi:hypothetical protein
MIDVQPASSQGITNPNPSVYPAATLLSPKRIEDSNGEFYFYVKQVTSAAARTSKSLDQERLSICRALGFELHHRDNLEFKNCNIGDTEVVPYGMVLLSTLLHIGRSQFYFISLP